MRVGGLDTLLVKHNKKFSDTITTKEYRCHLLIISSNFYYTIVLFSLCSTEVFRIFLDVSGQGLCIYTLSWQQDSRAGLHLFTVRRTDSWWATVNRNFHSVWRDWHVRPSPSSLVRRHRCRRHPCRPSRDLCFVELPLYKRLPVVSGRNNNNPFFIPSVWVPLSSRGTALVSFPFLVSVRPAVPTAGLVHPLRPDCQSTRGDGPSRQTPDVRPLLPCLVPPDCRRSGFSTVSCPLFPPARKTGDEATSRPGVSTLSLSSLSVVAFPCLKSRGLLFPSKSCVLLLVFFPSKVL